MSYNEFFQLWRVKDDKRSFGDFRTKNNYDPHFLPDMSYLADGRVYRSQVGAQASLWATVHKFLGRDHGNYLFDRLLNLFFVSVTLTPIVLWISSKFGENAGVASVVFMAASTGIAIFFTSLYWSVFIFFLPMALVCMHYDFEKFRLWHCSVLLFLSFLFKFLSGYEFISVILIMSIVPVLVDLPSAGIRLVVKKTIVIILTFLLAFAVSIIIFEYAFIKTFQESGIIYILSRGESWFQLHHPSFYLSQAARIMLMNFVSIGQYGIPVVIFFVAFLGFIIYRWNKLLLKSKVLIISSAAASLSWFTIQPIHILLHPRYAPLILFPLGLSLVVGVVQVVHNSSAQTS